MRAELREAIAHAAEKVDCIADMIAALHFITAPWLEQPMDGRDSLQIKALGGVLDVLGGFVKQAEDAIENVHQVAVNLP